MAQFIKRVLIDRWWIWVFILFFILLFRTEKEQQELEIQQNNPPLAEKSDDVPSVKQSQIENKPKEKEINHEEKKKMLQRKWDLKNGVILSTELTLAVLTKKIHEQYGLEEKPILHATNATIYYEYSIGNNFNIHATALTESQLLKSITIQIKSKEVAEDIFGLIVSSVSPEMGKEEAALLLDKMKNGDIHKFQTKKNIIYQWSALGESSILTVMKEKETQAVQTP